MTVWRIEVTEYHLRSEARIARPGKTLFRRRPTWRRLPWVGSATPGNWRSATDNVVSFAKERIPIDVDYEVVVLDREAE